MAGAVTAEEEEEEVFIPPVQGFAGEARGGRLGRRTKTARR
jgi:hypothetical protein